uniref:Uncharacterized protein n=1 Tax=Cacopsylla melanoneura TaxID=428564 RepID=A0A8D8R3M7_9HEMI
MFSIHQSRFSVGVFLDTIFSIIGCFWCLGKAARFTIDECQDEGDAEQYFDLHLSRRDYLCLSETLKTVWQVVRIRPTATGSVDSLGVWLLLIRADYLEQK